MLRKATAVSLAAGVLATGAFAQEGRIPTGIPHLDHVFVIMMENHGYQQIIGNPNEPYLNSLVSNGKVNLATKYFAVGHPSLTNYLEVVGGSNFAVRSDNAPAWGSMSCTPNIASGSVNADNANSQCHPHQRSHTRSGAMKLPCTALNRMAGSKLTPAMACVCPVPV